MTTIAKKILAFGPLAKFCSPGGGGGREGRLVVRWLKKPLPPHPFNGYSKYFIVKCTTDGVLGTIGDFEHD